MGSQEGWDGKQTCLEERVLGRVCDSLGLLSIMP